MSGRSLAMRSIETSRAPQPAGHYSQAVVPTQPLHYGALLEISAIAALTDSCKMS